MDYLVWDFPKDIFKIGAVAFTAACIGIGNFFNSEIIGRPSSLPFLAFSGQLLQWMPWLDDKSGDRSSKS